MLTRFLISCSFIASFSIAQELPKAEANGIRLITKGYAQENEPALLPFNSFNAGVEISFLLHFPQGGILDINTEKSTIDFFEDSKKTNLIEERDDFNSGFSSFNQVAKDGKAALFSVMSKLPPAADSTSVSTKGTVVIETATKKEEHKNEKVAIKAGTNFKAGDYAIEIDEAKAENGSTQLTFKSDSDLKKIADIQFLDAAGKKIVHDAQGTSSVGGFQGGIMYYASYRLEGEIANATIIISLWSDLKEVSIPFQSDVTLSIK